MWLLLYYDFNLTYLRYAGVSAVVGIPTTILFIGPLSSNTFVDWDGSAMPLGTYRTTFNLTAL